MTDIDPGRWIDVPAFFILMYSNLETCVKSLSTLLKHEDLYVSV